MNKTKRELVEKGGLFIPLLFSFGSRIEDVSPIQFLKDPTKIANALKTIQGFYRFPGIVCYSDSSVEAEALGGVLDWSIYPLKVVKGPPIDSEFQKRVEKIGSLGRIPIILDVVRRLSVMVKDLILVAPLTGPLTLASLLIGHEIPTLESNLLTLVSKAVLNLVRAYGEAGVDVIIVSEQALPELNEENSRQLRKIYSPMWNTAKFYEMVPILMSRKLTPSEVPLLARVADSFIFGHGDARGEDLFLRVGYAIPVDLLTQPAEEMRSFLKNFLTFDRLRTSKTLIVTTDSEIMPGAEKEALIQAIKTVQEYIRECREKN